MQNVKTSHLFTIIAVCIMVIGSVFIQMQSAKAINLPTAYEGKTYTVTSDYWKGKCGKTTRYFKGSCQYSVTRENGNIVVTLKNASIQCSTNNCSGTGWQAGLIVKDQDGKLLTTNNELIATTSGTLSWSKAKSAKGAKRTVSSTAKSFSIPESSIGEYIELSCFAKKPSGGYAGYDTARVSRFYPHQYNSEITTEATCTAAGVRTYTCKYCGKTYTETIEALGHDYKTTDKEDPTFKKDGYTVIECSRCGDREETKDISIRNTNTIKVTSIKRALDNYTNVGLNVTVTNVSPYDTVNSESEGTIVSYSTSADMSNANTVKIPAGETSTTISGLSYNTKYYITVKEYGTDNDGNEIESKTSTVYGCATYTHQQVFIKNASSDVCNVDKRSTSTMKYHNYTNKYTQYFGQRGYSGINTSGYFTKVYSYGVVGHCCIGTQYWLCNSGYSYLVPKTGYNWNTNNYMAYLKKNPNGVSWTTSPSKAKMGAICFTGKKGSKKATHTCIFVKYSGGKIYTLNFNKANSTGTITYDLDTDSTKKLTTKYYNGSYIQVSSTKYVRGFANLPN